MVSLKAIATLGIIGAAVFAYFKLGGAAGIGSRIGGGLNSFTSGIFNAISPFAQEDLSDKSSTNQENQQTLQGVVNDLGLANQVSDIPKDVPIPLDDVTRGRLTFAGLLQAEQLAGRINLTTGTFTNQYTTQPLDFAIGSGGVIKTGTVGLSEKTIAAQQTLSARYGIPTFDVKGNVSTFGGLVAGGGV